jgi:hypothetical protein
MKPDAWQVSAVQKGPERAAQEVALFDRPSQLVRKDQLLIVPGCPEL